MRPGTWGWIAAAVAGLGTAVPGYAITYRAYENPRLGVALAVPEEWEARQDPDGTVTINGSTGVLVITARPRGSCTPETLPQQAALYVLNDTTRLQNSGRKTVNGTSGWLFQYVTRNTDDPLRGDTFCLLHDDYLVIIAFVTRDWLYRASRPVFERCIGSIRLTTPPGVKPLAAGYRRYEDPEHTFRLQVPEGWVQQGDARMPTFSAEDGSLQLFTDASARYLAGDAEILARAYVDKANYRLKSLARGKLDGQAAEFAFCTPADRPEWESCFIVMVRDQKLYVLKISHPAERRQTLVQDVVQSFQFTAPAHPEASRTPPQVSRAANEKTATP